MAALVNQPTNQSVADYIAAVPNKVRQADAQQLLAVIKEITGEEPVIWGKSIIGFGRYTYQRKDGSEHEWFNVGFSPAKAHLSVYCMFDLQTEPLLEQMGPHSKGRGCLYIKRLEHVNLEVLRQLITKSYRWNRS